MRRIMTILALLALAAMLAAPVAAGPFKRARKKAEPAPVHKTWRFDRLPTMSFAKGELHSDIPGAWKLGKLDLELAPDCEIVGATGTGPGRLVTGRTAIVMGPRVGNTIVAWQIRLQKTLAVRRAPSSDVNIEWSESDPSVGVGTAPN